MAATKPTLSLQSAQRSTRAGRYVPQREGYDAFHPAPFPPHDLVLSPTILQLLSQADLELGKLIGAAEVLPNPDLFMLMYVRREAVLSSQIEGTQASLMDVLEYEAVKDRGDREIDVQEVSNYIAALRFGLKRVKTLPLSLRLIREIHARLMKGARGGDPTKTPGEFRRSQNWVGGPSPATARYMPPPVKEMKTALYEFEKFLHDLSAYPLLINLGLAHAHFETIHPFLDGNGRIGRLLVTFLLCEHGVLKEPLLYLSIFFKQHRQEYYDRLQAIRDQGDWESWLAFFLQGVGTVAREATETAGRIVHLRERLRTKLSSKLGRRSASGLQLLDRLFDTPVVTVKTVQGLVGLSQPAAAALVNRLGEVKVLVETTGGLRNRVFAFDDYLKLFGERERRS